MKNIKQNNLILGCLCALCCESIYGLSYMFTKQATGIASAFALLGWRFLIAAAVMSLLVFVGIIKLDLKGKDPKPLLLVALLNPCVYLIAETIGIDHTTASESGVILACIPVASLAASTLILKKKPSKFQLIGILITLLGVLITVFAVGSSSSLSPIGYTLLITAVLVYALYFVFVEKAAAFTGAEITYAMLLAGAAFFTVLALGEAAVNGTVSELLSLPLCEKGFLIAVLYQAVGSSVIAFFLSNTAIAAIGVNRTSSFIGVSTVVSIAAGIIILHEAFSAYQLIGAIVIIIGIYTANADKSE